jgi:hypothetical protein
MKNLVLTLFATMLCIGVFAQFTNVKVNLYGNCMSSNSNSRYVIKVEILNISANPPVAVITPVINTYATEGFNNPVVIDIDETACTPDGNTNIYKVFVSAAKVWWPNGPIICDGKDEVQPEYTCWGLINTLPNYPITVNLD